MLTNSAIAGALASAYLTVLVLHLNPSFPMTLAAVVPLALVMALAYGVSVTVLFYGLIVLRALTATEVLSPGWLSVRLLSWLCTIVAGGSATVIWLNVGGFVPVLDVQAAGRLTDAAITLTASTGVFLLIAFAHLGRRGGRVSAMLLTAMMVISIAAPFAARGLGGEEPLAARPTAPIVGLETAPSEGRVIVFALDGATLDVIAPAVAEGRLPNFGRILEQGAVRHLATLRPTQAEPVWSAATTGRAPIANGVRASALYRVRAAGPPLELLPDYCFAQALVRFGLLQEDPHDADSLRARPLWSILGDVGVSVGVIGFPLTHPAPAVNGLLVSEEFHLMTDAKLDLEGVVAVGPSSMLPFVRAAIGVPPVSDPVALVSAFAQAPPGDVDARPDPAPVLGDRIHLQILGALETDMRPRFVAVRLPGLDAVGHYFVRYAYPSAFGDVSEDEQRRFGRVLTDYYGVIDTAIGHALEALGPEDLLIVVSGFGMEPLSPSKRVLERIFGNARLSGTHERAPDGFLLAYGAAVEPSRPERASVLDITPTLLYFLGLPVGRDMEGFARTDLFRPSFTVSRPITFIPTYGR